MYENEQQEFSFGVLEFWREKGEIRMEKTTHPNKLNFFSLLEDFRDFLPVLRYNVFKH